MSSQVAPDEADIATIKIKQFIQLYYLYKAQYSPDKFLELAAQLTYLIKQVHTDHLSPEVILDLVSPHFDNIVYRLHQPDMLKKDKKEVYCQLVKAILGKILDIFKKNKMYKLTIDTLREMFKPFNSFFYQQGKSSKGFFSFSAGAQKEVVLPTDQYLACLNFLKEELVKYSKQIWNMELRQVISLFELFNELQKSKNTKTEVIELYDAFYTEMMAFYQSGRPQLAKHADYNKLQDMGNALCRSLESHSKKQKYEFIIPTISKTLITMGESNRLSGIKLLNHHCKRVFTFDYSAEGDRLKTWLNKNELALHILRKDITEVEYDESKYILKAYSKSMYGQAKTDQLLKILRDNNNENKWVNKFCFKELDVYGMTADEKMSFVNFLEKREDIYTNYPDYFECLDDLVYRMDSAQVVCKPLFNIFFRIIEESFDNLSLSLQNKALSGLKISTKGFKSTFRNKDNAEKMSYCKDLLARIFKKTDMRAILMFNSIFDQGQFSRIFSNNPIQTLMNYLIEQMQLLGKIFEFLEAAETAEMHPIVKTIQFVAGKCSIKIDVTQKYLKTLAKFPQLYESLLASQGYQKVQNQMQTVLELLKNEPDTPFHLLKTTFFKANYKNLVEYRKQASLLVHHKEQSSLRYNPSELEWYEQIISLMEEAPTQCLRQQIAQFVANLHMNYYNDQMSKKDKLRQYLASVVDYFTQNTKSYRKGQASSKSILANFELIFQMMKFTDILGVGSARPHGSLVSTKTISLTIINNVTFGDDIKKVVSGNFPTSMILFDLLASVGLSFKCGPEDLILKQGGRFIPIINNGRILENLQLTNEEIIAERNQANFLQYPEIFGQVKNWSQTFNAIYLTCLREVFDRFAYDGKMSQIEAINYLRQVSGSYVMAYDRRIRDMFEDFDNDKDGVLTFADFVNYNLRDLKGMVSSYYKKQFLTGLQNLRYRKNMTLCHEPLDISNRYNDMMRYVIEKHPEVYDELFNFAKEEDSQISEKAKELLLYLPTCPTMKEINPSTFDFSSNTQFFIFYKLIVLESGLNSFDSKLSEEERKAVKAEKIDIFIKNKYNQVIFQLLQALYSKIDENQYTYKSFTICLKILRSIIAIDNLTETKTTTLKAATQPIHSLPHTTFFAEEAIKALNAKNIINFEVLLVLQLTQETIDLKPIIEGCFNEDQDIRRTCCNFVFLWESKVNWKDNLFQINIPQKDCLQWFDLLSTIIQTTQITEVKQILGNTLFCLDKLEQNIYNRDNALLYGYLKILAALISKQKKLGEQQILRSSLPKLLDKTFSQKSRSLLFNILIVADSKLLIDYFNTMLMSVLPSQQCQIRSQYMGLKNLGATCYMNSIIQQFFMIEKFRSLVLNKKIPIEGKQVEVGGKMIVDDFMYQLQRMYFNLQYSQKKSFIPKEFCYANKDYDGKPINTSIQQDSHQFLNRLVENMENLCKLDQTLPSLRQICQLRTLSEYECSECKNRIDKIESHYSCMLEVKQQASLAESLKRMTDKEQIEDYTCENCKKKVKSIVKRTYLYELPEIIILNLQRIIFDPKKGDKIKVHSSLPFPHELDLQEYVKNEQVNETKYNLKGVVIHTGTSEGGHYYSLIRDNNSQQKWLKFNDQNVIPFEQKQIEREAFGGFEAKDNDLPSEITYSTNAYILFYERVNAKKDEMCEIQNDLSEEVQQENQKLIKEVQVHQECFFTAINRLYQRNRLSNIQESLKKSNFVENAIDPKKKQLYLELLHIHQKAFSFITIFTSLKSQTRQKIGQNLVELYHVLPEQTEKFFKQLNTDTFNQNLLTHNDPLFRQSIKKIFATNILTYLQYFGIMIDEPERQESKMIRNILDQIFGQLHGQKIFANFGKAEAYFNLILEMIKGHSGIRTYFLQKNLMFYLLDLIMGRQSSYMKYHPKAQDLPTDIVASIHVVIEELIFCKKNMNGAHTGDKYFAPYFQTTSIEAKIIFSPTFYRRIFRLNYEHETIKHLILHYSFEDPEYTIMICEILSNQITKPDYHNLSFLISIYSGLLTCQDKMRQLRYSCLLGFPQYVEAKPHNFCLRTSDASDNTHYTVGYAPNKAHSDKKSLLQIIFSDRKNNNTVLYGLKIILAIAESYDSFYDYIMSIPPPNYLHSCLFDLVPSISLRLKEDENFIIENKAEKMTQINSLYQIITEKMTEKQTKLPVKSFIIGKTTAEQVVEKIEALQYVIQLSRYTTYVLDNVPVDSKNKSMDKDFSDYQPKGIANLFIDYRSKHNYKAPKDIKEKPTVYVLRGKTKEKLMITFKQLAYNFKVIIGDGDFNINFPYLRQGQIEQLLSIDVIADKYIKVEPELLVDIFGVQEEQKMIEQQKVMDVQSPKGQIPFGKIECSQCTYLNDLTRERCQMCDHLIFV